MDFIAKTDIPWGGVLAYTRGQRVAADAVKTHGWDELVVAEDSVEARQIQAEITGRPAGEPAAKTTARTARATVQEG